MEFFSQVHCGQNVFFAKVQLICGEYEHKLFFLFLTVKCDFQKIKMY